MVRLFLTIIAILSSSLAVADDLGKVPDGFEKIAAELKAKKQELEPFDRKKVKVDLESLGLDDVDNANKNPEIKKSEQAAESKAPPLISDPVPGQKSVLIENNLEDKTKETPKALNMELTRPTVVVPTPNKATDLAVKPAEKAKDIAVKQPVKTSSKPKRASYKKTKKTTTENEKIQKAKSQELNELREKYLSQFDEKKNVEKDEEIIIPRRKEIGKFIVDETPPPPILNRFRTKENTHIPTVATKDQMNELLFAAVATDNISLFTDSLREIENINAKNRNGDTLLTFAVLMKKYSIIASLLEKGADPNMPNKLGYSPLNIAIEMLDEESFELLFNGGADINYIDSLGRTYLMYASKAGFLPGVEALIAGGVDINAMDNDGFTALAIAHRYKKDIIVKYLLKHGAKTWIEKPQEPSSQSIIKELENRWKNF